MRFQTSWFLCSFPAVQVLPSSIKAEDFTERTRLYSHRFVMPGEDPPQSQFEGPCDSLTFCKRCRQAKEPMALLLLSEIVQPARTPLDVVCIRSRACKASCNSSCPATCAHSIALRRHVLRETRNPLTRLPGRRRLQLPGKCYLLLELLSLRDFTT